MSTLLCQEAQEAIVKYNRHFPAEYINKIAQKDEKTQVQSVVNPYFQWIMENYCMPAVGLSGSGQSSATTKTTTTTTTTPTTVTPVVETKKPDSDEEDGIDFDIFA